MRHTAGTGGSIRLKRPVKGGLIRGLPRMGAM